MRESRKTRYTKQALRDALIDLLQTEPMTAVTVTELCRRADLNRGTFYLHYANPAELLDDVEEDLFAAFVASWKDSPVIDDYEFGLSIVRELARVPKTAAVVIRPGSSLITRVLAFQRERTQQLYETSFPEMSTDDLAYARVFIEQGTVSVIRAWVESGMKESPEHIATVLDQLACRVQR